MEGNIVIPEKNAALVVSALKDYGIVNPYMQAAILAILWKESRIQPVRENMKYTSADRLRFVFQTAFKGKDDAFVNQYVNNPEGLANYVYGGKYGNTAPGDGYKYRGGGYNGITFKSGYQRYGDMTGYDLVNNPDLLRDPAISADAIAAYYADTLKQINKYMGIPNANDVTDIATAVRAAMRATAGWGNSVNGNIFKEGEAKATAVAPQMYNFVRSLTPAVENKLEPIKDKAREKKKINVKRMMLYSLGAVALAGGVYALTQRR